MFWKHFVMTDSKIKDAFDYIVSIKNKIEDETNGYDKKKTSQGFLLPLKAAEPRLMSCESEIKLLKTLLENYVSIGELVYIMPKLQEMMPIIFKNAYTRQNAYVTLRKILRSKFSEEKLILDHIQSYFHIGKLTHARLSVKYAQKVYDQHQIQTKISDDDLYEICFNLWKSVDWKDKMILVSLASGARMIEIARLTVFETDGLKTVKVSNLAKKRRGTFTLVRPVHFMTSNALVQLVEGIREELKKEISNYDLMTNSELSQRISPRLQKRVKEKVIINGNTITFHKLRSLYAEWAWHNVKDKTTLSQTAYMSQILGHKPGSLTTALSYQNYKVTS